jgi:hypothetical protein
MPGRGRAGPAKRLARLGRASVPPAVTLGVEVGTERTTQMRPRQTEEYYQPLGPGLLCRTDDVSVASLARLDFCFLRKNCHWQRIALGQPCLHGASTPKTRTPRSDPGSSPVVQLESWTETAGLSSAEPSVPSCRPATSGAAASPRYSFSSRSTPAGRTSTDEVLK